MKGEAGFLEGTRGFFSVVPLIQTALGGRDGSSQHPEEEMESQVASFKVA